VRASAKRYFSGLFRTLTGALWVGTLRFLFLTGRPRVARILFSCLLSCTLLLIVLHHYLRHEVCQTKPLKAWSTTSQQLRLRINNKRSNKWTA
jgi:hypothetical protein